MYVCRYVNLYVKNTHTYIYISWMCRYTFYTSNDMSYTVYFIVVSGSWQPTDQSSWRFKPAIPWVRYQGDDQIHFDGEQTGPNPTGLETQSFSSGEPTVNRPGTETVWSRPNTTSFWAFANASLWRASWFVWRPSDPGQMWTAPNLHWLMLWDQTSLLFVIL